MDNKIGILDPNGINLNPLTKTEYTDNYKKLGKIWSKFPAYQNPEEIILKIKNNQVTLVISGTGSGKTVLLPKYALHALDYDGKIGITLPKQIIAKSAAEFAASTLDVIVGEEVGYQYKGSSKSAKSNKNKLLYCTDGTMVSMLLSDPLLQDFDIVIIDEAHERKINIDILLYLLKNTLLKRPEFKLIIMSATIDKNIFINYYSQFSMEIIEIGGKTNYPIKSIFLDNPLNVNKKEYLKKGVEIIKHLILREINNDSGNLDNEDKSDSDIGIIFFVTSVLETKDICNIINDDNEINPESNVCISVYSGMSTDQERLATDQEYFVQEFNKNGKMKIKLVIATNVAESSLTISGIKYVIDSGLELKSSYDNVDRVNILEKKLISHAQAKQRMGRTGRTGPGTCYHLYTNKDFLENMVKFPEPAIRSEPITSELLRLLNMDFIGSVDKLYKILDEFIEPPDKNYVKRDLEYLQKIKLIDDDMISITNLGKIIVDLRLSPEEGKALFLSYRLFVFKEVLAVIMLMNACKYSMSELFFFVDSLDDTDNNTDNNVDINVGKKNGKMKKKFEKEKGEFNNIYGDLIALFKICKKYEEYKNHNDKLNDFIYRKFLRRDVLKRSYDSYSKNMYRYKNILSTAQSQEDNKNLFKKIDRGILNENNLYKILSCFQYGFSENTLRMTKNNELSITKNDKSALIKKKDKIVVDEDSFMNTKDLKKNTTKKILYITLFKFDDTPIKAKITTFSSKKSDDLYKKLI